MPARWIWPATARRSEPLSGLSGTILSSGTAASTLTTTVSSGVSTFGGQFTSGAGTLALTKAGSGTLVLTATNQCAGTINLTGGTLAVPTGRHPRASPIYVGGTGGATLSVTGGLVSTSDNEYWALSSGVNANRAGLGEYHRRHAGPSRHRQRHGHGQWRKRAPPSNGPRPAACSPRATAPSTWPMPPGELRNVAHRRHLQHHRAIELGERDNASDAPSHGPGEPRRRYVYQRGKRQRAQIDTLNVSGGTVHARRQWQQLRGGQRPRRRHFQPDRRPVPLQRCWSAPISAMARTARAS